MALLRPIAIVNLRNNFLNTGRNAWRSGRWLSSVDSSQASKETGCGSKKTELKKARTPIGRLDDSWESSSGKAEPQKAAPVTATSSDQASTPEDPFAPFPNARNPSTGEIGGPRGPEPTRYGDWEKKGRISDF